MGYEMRLGHCVTGLTHVTVGDSARESRRELSEVVVGERHSAARALRIRCAPFGNLEEYLNVRQVLMWTPYLDPARAGTVPRSCGCPARSLSEVNRCRAKMVESVVELEADRGTSRHVNGLGGGGADDVARKVARRRGRDRRVVQRLAHSRSGGRAAGQERRPDIYAGTQVPPS